MNENIVLQMTENQVKPETTLHDERPPEPPDKTLGSDTRPMCRHCVHVLNNRLLLFYVLIVRILLHTVGGGQWSSG